MHAQMVMLMVVYVALVLVTGLMDFLNRLFLYPFMIGALNVGARVQGKRVVYNVLSVDINAKRMNDGLKIKKGCLKWLIGYTTINVRLLVSSGAPFNPQKEMMLQITQNVTYIVRIALRMQVEQELKCLWS